MPKVGSVHGGSKRSGSPAQGSVSEYVSGKGSARLSSNTGKVQLIKGGSVNVAAQIGKASSGKIK